MVHSASLLLSVLRNLVLPPTGPMLLMLAGALLARWWRRVGALLAVTGFLALWLLCTPWVSQRLTHALERYPPLAPAALRSAAAGAQAIVILSADVRIAEPEFGGDAPADRTLQRMLYGARVARLTGLPVMVSGGYVDSTQPIAAVMRDFLQRDFATPVRWVEDRSRNTHENARNAAALFGPEGIRRVVLVTSALHMARAVTEFRAAGLDVIPAPCEATGPYVSRLLAWIPNMNAARRSHDALYEALGSLVRDWRYE
ncbi:MAG TPA: YdcF family protein [Steroidobacteraceae bacterium]|nr:YdcF family protein [Steroidobacteraceae bacterium]